MEIAAELMDNVDSYFYHADYCVQVDNYRILTLLTHDYLLVSRWLKDVQKTIKTKIRDPLVVGLSFVNDPPYDLLHICIGSHCLIYYLPGPDYVIPKILRDFFKDPKIFVVGVNIKPIAEILETRHEISILNAMDLHELAVKAMQRPDLDIRRYDLDRLTQLVLGKHVYVVKPPNLKKRQNTRRHLFWDRNHLTLDEVKYATVDVYIFFLLGSKLLEMIRPPASPSSRSKKNKKK